MEGIRSKDGREIKMDGGGLYREETFTDLRVGTIRRLVPVTVEGEEDRTRAARFTATAQVMTPSGPLPLSGGIEGAKTLAEAVERFPEAIGKAVGALREEMAALQRERASQIVVPGQGGAGGPGGLLVR